MKTSYILYFPLNITHKSVYYINTTEIPSELSRENFLYSHMKITYT